MDWIDPKHQTGEFDAPEPAAPTGAAPKRRPRRKSLASQLQAALAQPTRVWGEAFDQSLAQLKWKRGLSLESTFLFSAVSCEQAEVLVRAGVSAKKLSSIVSKADIDQAMTQSMQISQVVGLMDRPLEAIATQWLDDSEAYASAALGVAALAWHLPFHAERPGNDWLTQWLQNLTDRIHGYKPDLEEAVLCHLIAQCEMPLLLSVATSASRRVAIPEATRAMDHLAEYLERGMDEPGPWLVHGASYLRAALASVVRCRVLANSLGLRKWYPPQARALVYLLKHAARWSRPSGTQMLAAKKLSPKYKAVWNALRDQSGRPKELMLACGYAGIGETSRKELLSVAKKSPKKKKPKKLPALTHYDADASTAVMRCDWKHKGGQVAIDFSEQAPKLEALGPKGKAVIDGNWSISVLRDGQAQIQLDDWQEVCWFSDEDADYLELEAKFGPKAKVQRQVLLLREQRVLLLSDSLLCQTNDQWQISSRIPLGEGTKVSSPKKTTEVLLGSGNSKCLVLPLYLPEWKRQLMDSASLTASDSELIATSSTLGSSRLYMPIAISLCPSHATDQFTWRRLTVGEDLRLVGADEAVAFRLQYGQEQLLLYRTLAASRRRTALGMHTMADFYAGTFDAETGEPSTLLEVEPPDA